MIYEAFDFHIADGVARVIWNQPERGNPFDATFCREYAQIAIECDENPAVRAVLMTARGRFFSVGGDVKTFTRDRDALPRFIKSAAADLHAGVSRFARMDAPVVIGCHSLVTGGAVALTAAADFAIATADAHFYAAFTGIGFSCDCGTSYNLPRRVGQRRAFDFLVRNRTWTAAEALEYGLIGEVVADADALAATASALAAELAAGPTCAFGEIKRLFLSGNEQSLESQMELEARALARASRTEDAWGALNAVLKKEPAHFEGN